MIRSIVNCIYADTFDDNRSKADPVRRLRRKSSRRWGCQRRQWGADSEASSFLSLCSFTVFAWCGIFRDAAETWISHFQAVIDTDRAPSVFMDGLITGCKFNSQLAISSETRLREGKLADHSWPRMTSNYCWKAIVRTLIYPVLAHFQ